MPFRRTSNRHDIWREICAAHADLLSCVPAALVRNEKRFRAFVTAGVLVDEHDHGVVRLSDLSDAEIDGLWEFIYRKAAFDMEASLFDAFNEEHRRRHSR